MRTILRLIRWFGKVLERDGLGWSTMFGLAVAAFILGGMLGCLETRVLEIEYDIKLNAFRREAIRRGEMEAWRTPDGEYVYRWKEE